MLSLLSGCLLPGQAAAPRLPGTRPVVEASEYPSLQAAIDAVPLTGGMVRLPPGEFVITEPLTIQHEDFRMEGAGTATHIKNANTNGQPAIVIRSDAFDGKNPAQRKNQVKRRKRNNHFTQAHDDHVGAPAAIARRLVFPLPELILLKAGGS